MLFVSVVFCQVCECLALPLWTVLFISLWSTTAETKNGLLDANRSACLRFLVLRTKTQGDGELVQACGNVFINILTASLDSATGATSVSIAKPDVTWSAFNAALSRTSGIHSSLLRDESLTEKKRRSRHDVLKPHGAGLVYLCVLILLRRHSSCSDVHLNFNTMELRHRLNSRFPLSRDAFKTPGRFAKWDFETELACPRSGSSSQTEQKSWIWTQL